MASNPQDTNRGKVVNLHDTGGTEQNPFSKTTMWENRNSIGYCFAVTAVMFQFGFDYGMLLG
jgi:hypothetical protein